MPVQIRIFTTEAPMAQRRIFVCREIPTNKKLLPQNLYMLNYDGRILSLVPGLRESVYDKCVRHQLDLRGYFRLSVSPDRRKSSSPSLCSLCFCGKPVFERKEISPKTPMQSGELARNSIHFGQHWIHIIVDLWGDMG